MEVIDHKMDVFKEVLITRVVRVPIQQVGQDMAYRLQEALNKHLSRKCWVEGYFKHNSVEVVSYTSGTFDAGDVLMTVTSKAVVANPVNHKNVIPCRVTISNMVGLWCELDWPERLDETPYDIVVPRDHHQSTLMYEKGDTINVKIENSQFVKGCPKICIIGTLLTQPGLDIDLPFGGNVEVAPFGLADIKANPDTIYVVEDKPKTWTKQPNVVTLNTKGMSDSPIKQDVINSFIEGLMKSDKIIFCEGFADTLKMTAPLTHAYLFNRLREFNFELNPASDEDDTSSTPESEDGSDASEV